MMLQRPDLAPRQTDTPGASGRPRTGWFRCSTDGSRWVWSDQMFAIHGFHAGDVVPTSALVRAHCHPQDRDRLDAALSGARAGADPTSVTYRLVDAAGRERWALLVAAIGADGPEIRGTLTDLTADLEVTAARRADVMIAASAESRSTIDQAKGALMLAYGVTADDAFEVLRRNSEHLNVKVRQLARRTLAAIGAQSGPAPAQVRAALEAAMVGQPTAPAPSDDVSADARSEAP